MKTKVLGMSSVLRQKLREVAEEGESVDKTLNRLLDDLETCGYSENQSRTSIQVTEATHKRLLDAKCGDETIVKVIERAIRSQQ